MKDDRLETILTKLEQNGIGNAELIRAYIEEAEQEIQYRHKRKQKELEIIKIKNDILLHGEGNVTEKRAKGELETIPLQEEILRLQEHQHLHENLKLCYEMIVRTG